MRKNIRVSLSIQYLLYTYVYICKIQFSLNSVLNVRAQNQ
jgi:hypothetical protein